MSRWTVLLLVLAVVIPLAGFLALPRLLPSEPMPLLPSGGSTFAPSRLKFQSQPWPPESDRAPRLTHVSIVDLDADGRPDVLACDARRCALAWYQASSEGAWHELLLADDVPMLAPSRAILVDLDADGDQDVVVAVLGSLAPTEDRLGRVLWLQRQDRLNFAAHTILDDVQRIHDVQAGDLDRDGDQDLVVAELGKDRGRVVWLEQRQAGKFRDRELLLAAGPVHVPLADFDGDGDLDIAALISGQEQAVVGLENNGEAVPPFREHSLFYTSNFDLGAVDLVPVDLDRDGDQDLLLVAGGDIEVEHRYPQPQHGCLWLENKGAWQFQPQRLVRLGGAAAAVPADLDGDGDLDIALCSRFNDWSLPNAASLIWLENDGRQKFTPWQIASTPAHLGTIAAGDVNADGRVDLVTGTLLETPRQTQRQSGVTLWTSQENRSP
jgi:hypothetical protein